MKTKMPAMIAILALGLPVALSSAPAAATPAAPQPVSEKKAADNGPAKPYPLSVCIVTDNDLGSMGDEQVMVYEGQTIKFCCKPCERKFLKNPAKYLKKLTPEVK